MNEDSILEKIRLWCETTQQASTLVSVGDDAAVLSSSGRPLAFASDMSIDGVHFNFAYSSASDVGYKSIARTLSDIAAMGAEARAVTISIALPKSLGPEQIEQFLKEYFEGAIAIAHETKCSLAGGDLTRLDGPIVIDVAAVGEMRPGAKAWTRGGARAGDAFFVSGPLGGAAFALELFRNGQAAKLSHQQAAKHRRPPPRFDVAEKLGTSNIHAAMDISDGLLRDAFRLCQASKVSLNIDEQALRLSPGATITHAFNGGDDYELMLATPADDPSAQALAEIGCYRLGEFTTPIRPGESEIFLRGANDRRTLVASAARPAGGHDPFRDI